MQRPSSLMLCLKYVLLFSMLKYSMQIMLHFSKWQFSQGRRRCSPKVLLQCVLTCTWISCKLKQNRSICVLPFTWWVQTSEMQYKPVTNLLEPEKKNKIKMKLNIAACDKLPCTVWNAVFEMLLWEWPTFRITELVLVWMYFNCCSTSVIKVKEKRFLWAKECISRRKEEVPSCVENWDCTKKTIWSSGIVFSETL